MYVYVCNYVFIHSFIRSFVHSHSFIHSFIVFVICAIKITYLLNYCLVAACGVPTAMTTEQINAMVQLHNEQRRFDGADQIAVVSNG